MERVLHRRFVGGRITTVEPGAAGGGIRAGQREGPSGICISSIENADLVVDGGGAEVSVGSVRNDMNINGDGATAYTDPTSTAPSRIVGSRKGLIPRLKFQEAPGMQDSWRFQPPSQPDPAQKR